MLANPMYRRPSFGLFLFAIFAVVASFAAATSPGLAQKDDTNLKIGTSDQGSGNKKKDDADLESLRKFIKDETGFNNEIVRVGNYKELASKLDKGELQLGAFLGFEYAWIKEKYPNLKPLAMAVNVTPFPVAHIVTNKNNPAKKIADLKQKSFAIADGTQGYLKLFVERQIEPAAMKEFFGEVKASKDFNVALNDVIDGKVAATVVDHVTLEAFQKRNKKRYAELNADFLVSPKMAPPVIVYNPGTLPAAKVDRVKDGLLKANQTARGEQTLELFRLTGFAAPNQELNLVLSNSLKDFPPPKK
jgi:ABC-type phosphate/phosphonate transport system substrate-binding protein